MSKSKIEWTDMTSNPIHLIRDDGSHGGHWCRKISAGCASCYAEEQNQNGFFSWASKLSYTGEVPENLILDELVLSELIKMKTPKKIFMCSMTDLFGDWIPNDWIDQIFAVMAIANHHTYQILTKRPQRMQQYFLSNFRPRVKKLIDNFPIRLEDKIGKGHSFDHLWLGTTIENQEVADQRLLALLEIPTNNLKFISGEPLLGEIDLSIYFGLYQIEDNGKWFLKFGSRWAKSPDWVIVGGESGSNARACNVEWIRSIVKQCQASEVPVFVKQLGSNPVDNEGKRIKLKHRQGGNMDEFPADLQLRQFPNN